MGKAKHLMHSLRSRITTSKFKASFLSTSLSSHPSTPRNDEQHQPSSTYSKLPSLVRDRHIQPITPSTARPRPRCRSLLANTPRTAYLDEGVSNARPVCTAAHVSAHVELAASLATLEFAKRLPLEEIRVMNRGPWIGGISHLEGLRGSGNGVGVAAGRTPAPFTLLRASSSSYQDHECTAEGQQHGLMQRSLMSDFQRSCAETVTLLSARTDSTWSFACRSARRMERVWQILRDYDDDAPPFHSFSESALFSESAVRIDLEQTDTLIDEVDFDDLPDWSDVEEEPDYNTRYKRDANVFPLTSTTPADVTCTNDTLIVPGVQFLQMVAMEKKRKKTDEIEDGTPTKRQKLRSNKGGGMGQRRWPRGTQSRSPGFARIRTRHQGQC